MRALVRELLNQIVIQSLIGITVRLALNPPAWVYVLTAIVAALGLFFWERQRQSPKAHPNWGIGDLFLYINPHTLTEEDWEEIGRQIQSKLSSGQLQSWGELELNENGRRQSLAPIPPDYWKNANLSYFFFAKGQIQQPDVWGAGRFDGHDYWNVQLNQAEAREVLKLKPARDGVDFRFGAAIALPLIVLLTLAILMSLPHLRKLVP